VQTEYAEMMGRIIKEIADHLPQAGSAAEHEAMAWAFLSTLIGGLTLSRAVGSGPAADQIARSSKATALGAINFSAD
jgi:hypothetical protein